MTGKRLVRGIAAGAAGTTALNAVTYLDMALRGRPPSDLPERAVEGLADDLGRRIPGDVPTRDNRVQALGALSGTAAGVTLGAVAAVLAPLRRLLPLPVDAIVVGVMAGVATNAPMARRGLTEPTNWTATDWAADAVPHLAYGVATAWTLRALGT